MKLISNRTLNFFFSLILLVLIGFLFYAKRNEVLGLLYHAEKKWVLAGFVCYLLNYLSRAWRLKVLISSTVAVSLLSAFKISSLHGFLSYLLPLRSGDFSLPVFLNRIAGISLLEGASVFFKARILDIQGLGVLLAISAIFSSSLRIPNLNTVFVFMGVAMVLMPFGLLYLLKHTDKYKVSFVRRYINDQALSASSVNEVLMSVNIWFWTGCTFFCVIKAVGISLKLVDAWLMAAIQLPLQLLPIQGLANSGNHEVGWVAGLTLFGFDRDVAFSASIASHLLLMGYVLALGVAGVIVQYKKPQL